MTNHQPPPAPPPPAGAPPPTGDGGGAVASRTWAKFRAWPTWAQIGSGVVVLFVLIVALGGGDDDEPAEVAAAAESTTTTPPPTFTERSRTPSTAGETMTQLEQLVVAAETSSDGYDRGLFGRGWIDADGDGCDTRCEVLADERRTDLPGLSHGGWHSLFDGYTTNDPSELDIDHVVALGEAWRSGAAQWDGARRLAFANDLDDLDPLIAVSAASNRSKSDRDPASWQPPSLDAWCQFAAAWIDTKHRWGLTADEAEVQALRNMLTSRDC